MKYHVTVPLSQVFIRRGQGKNMTYDLNRIEVKYIKLNNSSRIVKGNKKEIKDPEVGIVFHNIV
jgi:hypothetical protein